MSLAQQIQAWGTGRSISALNTDINDELDFHIQAHIDDLVLQGMSQSDAETCALREFGDRKSIAATCQSINLGWQVILTRASMVGLGLAICAIGWLAWSLYTIKNENHNLASQLETTMASLGAITAINPTEVISSAVQVNDDLNGKVTDATGNAIADAKVLLLHKSWPGGQYRQNAYETTTDANGKYVFDNQYNKTTQNAFLVTILAEGYEMQSSYEVFAIGKAAKAFNFKLKPVDTITFEFVTVAGPVADTPVFVQQRTVGRKEHMIYFDSSDSATWPTDADGKVAFGFFAPGDKVKFHFQVDGDWKELDVKIGKGATQKVDIDGRAVEDMGNDSVSDSAGDLRGTVMDAAGKPIANAKVLLVHKSWPNNRYQQAVFESTTDGSGVFNFKKQFQDDMRNAFLVTILADGNGMKSKYEVFDEGVDVSSFDFQLSPAIPISFEFVDEAGDPIVDAPVFLNQRKAGGTDHMIYFQSCESASWPTNLSGKLELGFLAPGDEVKFAVNLDGEWAEAPVTIDKDAGKAEKPSQKVVVKKKVK